MAYGTGDRVEWDRGNGTGSGKITKVHTQKVTKTLKGSEIARDESDDCPAYLIEQGDGDEVLKLHSELRRL